MNYPLELTTYLNKIYNKKIENILQKEDINNLKKLNLDELKSLIKSKEVFLGSSLHDFIISLIPENFDGYILRKAISEAHNATFPVLYDEKGNPLKNYTHNNFSTILWQQFTNESFINDLDSKFSKNDFHKYVDESLDEIYEELLNRIKIFKSENAIVIPYDKNNLVNTVKELLLNKTLSFSFALLVVDMDKLRAQMTNLAIDLDYYDEFDKLEDDLKECLDNYFKYTNEELLDLLITKEKFVLTDNNKLVKTI